MKDRKFESMDEVRAANRAAGMNFFEKDTMKFFKSRIESGVMFGEYFVTSESMSFENDPENRRYSIRRVRPDGTIERIGDFGAYAKRGEATRLITRIAQGLEPRLLDKDLQWYPELAAIDPKIYAAMDANAKRLWVLLSDTNPKHLDAIVTAIALPYPEVNTALVELDILELIRVHPANHYTRRVPEVRS